MALGDRVERFAVLDGLRNGLVLVAPAGILTAALTDDLPELLRLLFVLVIMAGFLTAGAAAARAESDSELQAATVAGALTYAALQIPLAVVRLARGEPLGIWTYVFLLLTSASLGLIGGLLVLRGRRRAEAGGDAPGEAPLDGEDGPAPAPS